MSCNKQFRIGDIVEFDKDEKLYSTIGEKEVNVKAGDTAIVTKHYFKYLTGNCAGLYAKPIDYVNTLETGKYNVNNISSMIFDRIRAHYGYVIDDMMEEEEITRDEIIEAIEMELREYI